MVTSLKPGKVRRVIDVDADDMDWYVNRYGQGSCSWLFTMLLKKFREVHTTTPDEMMKVGALEVKKMIEHGDVEVGEASE